MISKMFLQTQSLIAWVSFDFYQLSTDRLILYSVEFAGKMIDKKAELMKSQSLQVTTPQQQPLLQTIVNSASANTSHVSSTERKPSETVTSSMEDLGESDVTLAAVVSNESTSDAAQSLAAARGEEEDEEEPTKEAEVATETESTAEKETSESSEASDLEEKKEPKETSEASPQNPEDSSTFKKVRPSVVMKRHRQLIFFCISVPR
jgi:hypothetical protein